MMKLRFLSCLLFLFLASGVLAQVGVFEAQVDIGLENNPLAPSQVAYNGGAYTLDALGVSIGRETLRDEFNFVCSRMTGSFSIECDVFATQADGLGGLMIRQDLDVDSVHASYLRAADTIPGSNTDAANGTVFPYFRTAKGSGTNVDGDVGVGGYAANNTGPIKLERIGNSIHFYTMNDAGAWNYVQTEAIPLSETVYVGLAATANGGELGEFEFTDVAITPLPLWVKRSIPLENWTPGANVEITVTAHASETVDAVVNELTPIGTSVSNVRVSQGEVTFTQNGVIDWTVDGLTGEATLSYTATLGNGISGAWQGTFSEGINRTSYIGEDSILPKVPVVMPASEPFVIAPGTVSLIEAEQAQILDDQTGFLIYADPRASGGLGLINIANRGSLEYELNVQRAGTYYMIARTRGEDGNSDSFYMGIDILERTDPYGFGLANNRQWTIRWWENYDPAQRFWNLIAGDHKEFNLPAGRSFLVVQNRETGAKLDWFAFTDNPNEQIGLIGTPKQGQVLAINQTNPTPVKLVGGEAFIEAENGVLVTPTFGGHFSLFYDRNASEEVYVNSIGGATPANLNHHIDYHFEVVEPGPYRIIARTRTPSDSDDSFWVGMDDEPLISDNNFDRFQGSGIIDNSFHTSWIRTDGEPDKTWFLDAGVHVFRLYGREDNTQIDWLVITNKLDQDPLAYVPPGSEVPVLDFMLY
ncbi:MAG: hypothetical protein C4527_14120 [Candidatus Omnitrophota bacterium]|nr:MAG: hypothetical protein C4527_14120 [Candidatus Omnitrophota bacterium]